MKNSEIRETIISDCIEKDIPFIFKNNMNDMEFNFYDEHHAIGYSVYLFYDEHLTINNGYVKITLTSKDIHSLSVRKHCIVVHYNENDTIRIPIN